jgi:uncharacterized protein (DUF3084 family)
MSTSIEFERLRSEKSRLEEESRNLDSRLQQLETQSKLLNEKIAIQELKNENAAKQEAISQLESKIGFLETQLKKLLTGGSLEKEDSAEKQEVRKEGVDASGEEQEKDEDTITVTMLDKEEMIENI